jgi:arsenate reductase-like glutaredoxin family protein
LLEQGAELETQDLNRGLPAEELDRLIGERDYTLFLNTKNEIYRERKMKEKPPSRKEALELMAAHPNLIRRPITVRGKQIVLGFDPAGLQKLAG